MTAGILSAAVPSIEPKSTTRKTLWTLCVALLIATTVVFGTSLWTFQKIHNTVQTVHTGTGPAIIGVLKTQEALVAADRAAIGSLGMVQTQLTGPGQQYQNQIALAGQRLAQTAGYNAAGEDGSQTIQLVERLLVSYQNSIGHADANFRESQRRIGTADLWDAWQLHNEIRDQLNILMKHQWDALDRQLSANSIAWAVLVWAPPIVVLFVVLCVTQVFLKRRFRRTLNPLLSLATVLLVGLSAVMFLTILSQHRLQDSQESLRNLEKDWKALISAIDAEGKRELYGVVKNCVQAEGGCVITFTEFAADPPPADQVGAQFDALKKTAEVIDQIATASYYADLWFLIPLGTALIAVLIIIGLRARLEEYRYRPK